MSFFQWLINIIGSTMNLNVRFSWLFKLGSASMLSLIALGARYGHKGKLEEEDFKLFQKAQFYHLTNNVGLFCASLITPMSLPLKIAVGGFIGGSLIFVFPLYYMAVNGRNDYITKTMPLGGGAMLGAWMALIFA